MIPGWRRTIAATCDGWTNMPFTLVVWSARPIQPLIRALVRPHGARTGQERGEIAGAEANQRIVALESVVTTTSPTSPAATGSPVPGPHDLDQHAFVDDQARRALRVS